MFGHRGKEPPMELSFLEVPLIIGFLSSADLTQNYGKFDFEFC